MDTYIILGVLALMIVAMLSGKFDFGFPPIAAVTILAATGVVTVQEAFSGFVNDYLIITAAFLVLGAAFAKTPVVDRIRHGVLALQERISGVALLLVMIVATILLANLLQPGPAVLLVVVMLSTLPGDGAMTARQMLLPLGAVANLGMAKIPVGVAVLGVVWLNGFFEASGSPERIGVQHFMLIGAVPLVVAVLYSLVAWRMLPRGPLAAAADAEEAATRPRQSRKDEIVTYVVFLASVLAVVFADQLGDRLPVVPVVGVLVLLVTRAMSADEVRSILSLSIVFLLAGVFSLSTIMSEKGVSTVLGEGIRTALGAGANGWVLLFVFAFATVVMANVTGSNFGTLFIMVPIAVSAAVAVGIDPRGIAIAVVMSALSSIVLPLDTAMGITIASGGYRLATTMKYTVPLTVVYIVAVCLSAAVVFPM